MRTYRSLFSVVLVAAFVAAVSAMSAAPVPQFGAPAWVRKAKRRDQPDAAQD